MKLIDSLYAYVWQGNDNNCNSYVFSGVLSGGKHVVIDPGHITTPVFREQGLDRLLKEMEAEGIDGEAIGMVILTHAHPDHCEAAMAIREKNGALVALHQGDITMYKSLGGKADLYLDEGELVLGENEQLRLSVYHSPGHSPGHLAFYWPGRKVLIVGDLIFYRDTGRVDLPGGNPHDLKNSIERLSQLDVEYLLCGHPYGHSGIIQGKGAVRENFDFLKKNILF